MGSFVSSCFPRWAITSFEASGDQLAEYCLSSWASSVDWVGVEGRPYSHRLQTCIALPSVFHQAYGAIGLYGFLRRWLGLRSACKVLGDRLLASNLVGIVVVDFPSLHVRLLKYLKSKQPHLKIVYLAPPKTWASRSGRLKVLKQYVDQLVTIFDYEHQYFRQHQLPCLLLKSPWVNEALPPQVYPKKESNTGSLYVLVYPGSRARELKIHLPVVIQALRLLHREQQRVVEAYISIPQLLWSEVPKLPLLDSGVQITYFCDEWMPLREHFVAWVCSGTMTAKVATWGLPMVVMYGLDLLSYMILRLLYRSFLAIPNIILNQRAYPELVGPQLTPRALVRASRELRQPHRQEEFSRLSKTLWVKQAQGMSWREGLASVFQSALTTPEKRASL